MSFRTLAPVAGLVATYASKLASLRQVLSLHGVAELRLLGGGGFTPMAPATRLRLSALGVQLPSPLASNGDREPW